MARVLKLDPVVVLTETDPERNAVRSAAALVYQRDDEAAAKKSKAKH